MAFRTTGRIWKQRIKKLFRMFSHKRDLGGGGVPFVYPFKHYPQNVITDEDGIKRFQKNEIVRFLLDYASERGMNLNQLAVMGFDKNDWRQFSQLTGYSTSGFFDLSYVRPYDEDEKDDHYAEWLEKELDEIHGMGYW